MSILFGFQTLPPTVSQFSQLAADKGPSTKNQTRPSGVLSITPADVPTTLSWTKYAPKFTPDAKRLTPHPKS